MRKLKRLLLVLGLLLAVFAVYVEIVNRNSPAMTYRQKVLKAIYPIWMGFTRLTGKNTKKLSNPDKTPPVSFYTLHTVTNSGEDFPFETLRGKKVLLVNTASNCGYTNQYTALQQLADTYQDRLLVLAFPSNDFKEQESGTDAEIAAFCKKNFGIRFPLMQKSPVLPSPAQNPVFRWLSDSTQNGWNSKAPSWNFSKYLVNEEGKLTHYFDPSVSPLSGSVTEAIEK